MLQLHLQRLHPPPHRQRQPLSCTRTLTQPKRWRRPCQIADLARTRIRHHRLGDHTFLGSVRPGRAAVAGARGRGLARGVGCEVPEEDLTVFAW
jgi:hypothetical protein